jgi:hypothetical protein
MMALSKNKFVLLFKALGTFFSLDSNQRKIVFHRKIEGSHTNDYWLLTLKKIAQYDMYADKVRPTVNLLFWWFFITPCVFFTAGFIFSDEIEGSFGRMFWSLAFPMKLLLYSSPVLFILHKALKRIDIPNHLREFVVPMIAILKEEMALEALLDLRVELSKNTHKKYQINQQKNYSISKFARFMTWLPLYVILVTAFALAFNMYILGESKDDVYISISIFGLIGTIVTFIISFFFGPRYPRIVTTTYLYPWLSFTAKLADRGILLCNFEEEITKIKITRSKTNARGKTKIKTKIKYKTKENYDVKVALPKKNYELAKAQPRQQVGVKFAQKEDEKRYVFKTERKSKQKSIGTLTETSPDLNKFLATIGGIYQRMKEVETP